ncbi:hypothetical protein RF11_11764 [Thelohanellus kitauei]|uniref:Uncharacterized protein n=1 Tax=Thelohanellus kitauei TaxID=669202 RepID=A0A0C2J0C5_THEKT|nr:hypothetical protein RF11_11764 [Thelohanellus kitauei]
MRARLASPNWSDEPPWVLLGIRTAVKEDIGCSSAELVYGSCLRIAGEFVKNQYHTPNASAYLMILREKVNRLAQTPTSQHGSCRKHINPIELQKCRYVFVMHDSNKSAL